MKHNDKRFASKLSNVRGLGSAKDGVSHWVWQRITALAMIPLTLWFLVSLMSMLQANDVIAVQDWFYSPVNALLCIVLFAAIFFHATLGVQVVIEDYVHETTLKNIALIGTKIVFFTAGILSIMAIIKLHFLA
jgi:succinate dehydrogenase / fumarate reductase, membrane anchor subunit